MEKNCICCSMPMTEAAHHALGDTSKEYCLHCAKEDGSMLSYEEVLEGSVPWGMENFTLMGFEKQPTEAEMRKALVAHMATLPAWKNKK